MEKLFKISLSLEVESSEKVNEVIELASEVLKEVIREAIESKK